MRKTGFTLVELLVVIAIIAIIAAILFPVFGRAREKGRQASCLSNTKQLVIACLGYAQDYDELLPREDYNHGGNGNTPGVDGTWRGVITPYCRNAQIFVCPSHRPAGDQFDGRYNDAGQVASYAINDAHQYVGPPEPPRGAALAQMQDASSIIFLLESDGAPADITRGGNARGWVPAEACFRRHNDGCNYSFVDGHAKWLKPSAIDSARRDSLLSMEQE